MARSRGQLIGSSRRRVGRDQEPAEGQDSGITTGETVTLGAGGQDRQQTPEQQQESTAPAPQQTTSP
jgi:hypothetical protein